MIATAAPAIATASAVEAAVLSRNARRKGAEILFTCPNAERHQHGDEHPSAQWNPDKQTWWCPVCDLGGGFIDLARLLGILPAVSANGRVHAPEPRRERQRVTVEALAAAKGLPAEFLKKLGLHNLPGGGVGIPYRDTSGAVVQVKRRTALVARDGSYWPKGAPLMAYGLERLATYNGEEPLHFGEGESDVWTLWLHGRPALGLPGAQSPARCLRAAHLPPSEAGAVIWCDRDGGAGAQFAAQVHARLAAFGWDMSRVLIAQTPDGCKDLNDLHRLHGNDFDEMLAGCLEAAQEAPAAAVPNSHSPYREVGIGNDARTVEDAIARVVKAWEAAEPAARLFVVEELLPALAVTILYGDGGQGKSLLAVYLAILIALGRSFAGRAVQRSRSVLYMDGELDATEFLRRAYRVARGMELEGPPAGLHYWQLPGPLSDPKVLALAGEVVEACGADLVVLDSLTVSTYGLDIKEAGDTTAVIKGVERWGATVLAIDHQRAPQAGVNLSSYRPFGTTFKFNLARSVLQLVKAEGGGVVLRQTKSNFGPLAEPVNLSLDFTADAVRFEVIESGDDRMAGIQEHLPAAERVLCALAECGAQGDSPEGLAKALNMAEKTVRNYLSAHRRAGRAEPIDGARWRAVQRSQNPNSLKGVGIGNGAPDGDAGAYEEGSV